jgi:hypothetical protein
MPLKPGGTLTLKAPVAVLKNGKIYIPIGSVEIAGTVVSEHVAVQPAGDITN